MEILYDISVLGRCYRRPSARTGVFRTVEQVARALVRSSEVQVSFCAGECNFSQCREYLQSLPDYRGIPFVESHTPLARLRNEVSRRAAGGDERTVGWLRYPTVKAAYDLCKGYADPLGKGGRTAALYHSPFDHVPPLVLGRRPRLPVFLTVYDLIPQLFPGYFDTPQDLYQRQRIMPLQDNGFFLCISATTRDDLCSCFPRISPDRVFVTPLAAAASFYPCTDESRIDAVRSRYGISRDTRYFLSVCTLEPRKNIAHTIRCFQRLVRQEAIADLVLVLVGSYGWQYDDILAACDEGVDVHGRIILTGYVPDEDLAPLYSGALAFVYPSLYEGFGLPPLEAMQCGTPVITSNTSSLPEVVGDAGIMVDPTDSDALCQGMLELYRSPELRREMSRKGLLRAAEFSWARTVRETSSAYHEAIRGKTP